MYVISVFNIRGTQRKKNPDKARECWQRCCTKKQDEIHVCECKREKTKWVRHGTEGLRG